MRSRAGETGWGGWTACLYHPHPPLCGDLPHRGGGKARVKRGQIPPRYPDNPLIPLTFTKISPTSIHTLCRLSIIRAIALAGDLVRTGYQGRASVPDWSHNGVRLGDEPPSPGLDRAFQLKCCSPGEARPPDGRPQGRTKLLNERPNGRPSSRPHKRGQFFDNGQTRKRAWR
jgi:hypothetical protein